MPDATDIRTRAVDALVGELHRTQHMIEGMYAERSKMTTADFAKIVAPFVEHNLELLKLITSIAVDPKAEVTRFTKVLENT